MANNQFIKVCISPYLNLLSPGVANGDKVGHYWIPMQWNSTARLKKLHFPLLLICVLCIPLENIDESI
jgi:hypothetical protein